MSDFVASFKQNGTGSSFVNDASFASHMTTAKSDFRGRVVSTCGKALLGILAVYGALNINAMTSSSPIEVKPLVRSYKQVYEKDHKSPNIVEKSKSLKKIFNFNVSQWASLLKVERKTIYNWESKKDTRVINATLSRIEVFDKFAQEINPGHAIYLKKFIFGRLANESFRNTLYEEPLDFNKIADAYYDIYAQLEGYSVRAKLS